MVRKRKPEVRSQIGIKYLELLAPAARDFAGRRRAEERSMGPLVEARVKELKSLLRRRKRR